MKLIVTIVSFAFLAAAAPMDLGEHQITVDHNI